MLGDGDLLQSHIDRVPDDQFQRIFAVITEGAVYMIIK